MEPITNQDDVLKMRMHSLELAVVVTKAIIESGNGPQSAHDCGTWAISVAENFYDNYYAHEGK